MEAIPMYVGFDPREACVYHTFCQSVIETATHPVAFIPLHQGHLSGFDGQQDGTNAFIYSRYLVPYLMGYEGWALFCDGDMVVTSDIVELWQYCDPDKALLVVKHDYKTAHERKYIGTPIENRNIDYPRKNWSSVMLINCGHPSNAILTPEFVAESGGSVLHRFGWLQDDEIGELPPHWNHLVGEYDPAPAKLYHHTLGSPGFQNYMRCESHEHWNRALLNALHMEGEQPTEIVRRAQWRANGGNHELRDTSDGSWRLSGAI